MAFDVCNLYGAALATHLPTSNFKWIEEETLTLIRHNPKRWVYSKHDEGDVGYILEVDLFFPKEIHDKCKGLTPAPYKRRVHRHELSPYQQQFAEKLGISDNCISTERLITDLHPRKNYVVHYRVLKQYLKIGVQITHVHRGIHFSQSPVLKPYMDILAAKRQASKGNKFAENLWKVYNFIYLYSLLCCN